MIPKKEKKDCGRLRFALKIFLQINVHWLYSITWYLWPFIRTFCSLMSMDTWIFQHFKILTKHSLGTWNDGMYVATYAFNMCTRRSIGLKHTWGGGLLSHYIIFQGFHVWTSTMSLLWRIFTMVFHIMVSQNPKKSNAKKIHF